MVTNQKCASNRYIFLLWLVVLVLFMDYIFDSKTPKTQLDNLKVVRSSDWKLKVPVKVSAET